MRVSNSSSKQVYVSIGHGISLEQALEVVSACSKYRIPEPIRAADLGSRRAVENFRTGKWKGRVMLLNGKIV